MEEPPSTITRYGYEKRGRDARAPLSVLIQSCLEFFTNRVVDRIWPASADRDGETHHADQQDELVAALADQEAARPVGRKQCNQHLDCQRRRKETREQPYDQADPADRLKKHRGISKSQ